MFDKQHGCSTSLYISVSPNLGLSSLPHFSFNVFLLGLGANRQCGSADRGDVHGASPCRTLYAKTASLY